MAGRVQHYRSELKKRRGEWGSYLNANSGLPGPRANLELVEAARPLLEKWLHSSDPDIAWVMKGNLGKARMSALGTSSLAQLKVSPARSKSKLSHPMRKP